MNKPAFTILLVLLTCLFVHAQDERDFPSAGDYIYERGTTTSIMLCGEAERKADEITAGTFAREFYCNGNVHAECPIKEIKSSSVVDGKTKKAIVYTHYVRTGNWKVYFDSTAQVLRSEGAFKKGARDGKWTIYSTTGKPLYEFDYDEGQLKSKVEIDEYGNRQFTNEVPVTYL